MSKEKSKIKNKEGALNSKIRIALIVLVAAVALYFAYRLAFIKTVSYEIGGIKIPSKYNMLTGKATPISDYKGTDPVRVVEGKTNGKMGLNTPEMVGAKIRWAVFEQWVKNKPEYNGWDSNPELFKKAQEEFLAQMKRDGRKIQVLQ